MKFKKQVDKSKKSKKELKGQYLKVFRIYPYFLYHRLDKWLSKMSLDGWHIVHVGFFFFTFEKGTPQNKVYFTYGLTTQEKRFWLSLKHPTFEKQYAVSKRKSRINAEDKKRTPIIVEIDLDKISDQNYIGYQKLVDDRNKLYLKYFIYEFSVYSLAVLSLIIVYILS